MLLVRFAKQVGCGTDRLTENSALCSPKLPQLSSYDASQRESRDDVWNFFVERPPVMP